MKAEKTVRCTRDKLIETRDMTSSLIYKLHLDQNIDVLNWVLGE